MQTVGMGGDLAGFSQLRKSLPAGLAGRPGA